MSSYNPRSDPDDLFADTRMSFGDHLEELRTHMWRAVWGFLFAMVFSLFLGRDVLYNIIIRPVEEQLQLFYDKQSKDREEKVLNEIAQNPDQPANQAKFVQVQFLRSQIQAIHENKPFELEQDPDKVPAENWVTLQARIPEPVKVADALLPAQRLLGPRPSMKTFNVTEAFMVYFKISMAVGLVLSSPWVFWQLWSFVAAGLYRHEKRYIHVYLPLSLTLFLIGVCTCQWIVLPKAVSALLWFNEWLNIEPDLRLNEWLGFAIAFPVFFGLSFQTPLVMMFLDRLGILTVETFRSKRRIAIFTLAVIAALGPSIDMFSMMFQWIALCLLYELGIWLCIWSPSKPIFSTSGASEDDTLVEA